MMGQPRRSRWLGFVVVLFLGRFSVGNRLSVVTLSTRAKARSSSSVTQRSCASIWDSVPREISKPCN